MYIFLSDVRHNRRKHTILGPKYTSSIIPATTVVGGHHSIEQSTSPLLQKKGAQKFFMLQEKRKKQQSQNFDDFSMNITLTKSSIYYFEKIQIVSNLYSSIIAHLLAFLSEYRAF